MAESLEPEIWRRAKSRCEYCHLAYSSQAAPFQVDHVIARQHGGPNDLTNLALSCLRCNRHKGPNLAGIDPKTGRTVRLFHPRKDSWSRHFEWAGPLLIGKTAAARATIEVLTINAPTRVALRSELIAEGRFEP